MPTKPSSHNHNGLPCTKCWKIHADQTGDKNVSKRFDVRLKISQKTRGWRIPRLPYKCHECGKILYSHFRKPKQFCSRGCYTLFIRGSNNPNFGNHALKGRKFTPQRKINHQIGLRAAFTAGKGNRHGRLGQPWSAEEKQRISNGVKTYYETRQTHSRNYNHYVFHTESEFKKLKRNNALRYQYGISLEQFEFMKTAQGNTCGICLSLLGSGRAVHIDHSHTTNKIRGILCLHCNNAIGKFNDSIFLLQRAIEYLTNPLMLDIDAKTMVIASKIYQTDAKRKVRRILRDKQENRCAICQTIFDGKVPMVDHDHISNKLRGVLCSTCNSGLGMFKDNITVIRAAISYLEADGIPEIKSILATPTPMETPSTPNLLASTQHTLSSVVEPVNFAEFAKNWLM